MTAPRFLSVSLNPVLQKTLLLPALEPGQVNRLVEHRFDASGKGLNVARVLCQLGEEVTHLTQLGGRFRDRFLSLAAAEGLEVEWGESGAEIRFCYTLLETSRGLTTEIVEEAAPVSSVCEALLDGAFSALLPAASWVTISGSKASGFTPGVFPRWVAAARAAGKGVVLDVRGPDLVACLPFAPDVVKPNYEELVATFFAPRATPSEAEVEAVMATVAARYGVAVVVTRGARPTLVATPGERWQEPVEAVAALNETGSGDACTAGLVCALARGASLREALVEGHRCGALNARQVRPGSIR